jgi:tetratricopeptide (TPR) repeat protein
VTLWVFSTLRAAEPVKVWEETITIPTYLVGNPDPNPQFYLGGNSQGAEHRIYPYPSYDNLTTEKADKKYKIVYLENEYIKVGILPESGGKIFEAIDKTNGYNFFYRQHVIKPALISLLGAWISGGVEWDIPHHHRATSFLPVQYSIENNPDGTQTVWVGELELRDRMRWAVGATLRPGKALLEVSFRLINRTPVPASMLCFSNVAVHVNDDYQVIYPPSTQLVTYHGKVEFATWPIGSGRFRGTDFTGIDESWYKNHLSSNSMFAWNYQDDFLAGYDHGKHAGTMSVADHNVVPGKKFWTWGAGPGGRVQDRLLTDSDGPYIELMVGAYSDNQPDYTWVQPYESRRWTQYWYPFRDIDGVKNANTDAAVNLDVKDGKVRFGFYTTAAYPNATVSLKLKDQVLSSEQMAISPAKPYTKEVALPSGANEHDLRAAISADGKELIAYSPITLQKQELPPPVTPFAAPSEIKTNEELYLAGLRIDQFRAPNAEPEPYWEEALKRDPGDIRVNTAMAINEIKKARYADAEKHLRAALARATDRYTTPKDTEPFYYLGLALRGQGKTDEAFANFYKSTWGAAWRSPGYFELAQIASARGDLEGAVGYLDRAISADGANIRALTFKIAALCILGREEEARPLLAEAARIDPLDLDVLVARAMLEKSDAARQRVNETMQQFPNTVLEVAAECINVGRWSNGSQFLSNYVDAVPDKSKVSPLIYYCLGYFAQKQSEPQKATEYYQLASKASTDYVFPFQREMIDVLEAAMQANPSDAQAPYYLGNLLYDWQPERAVAMWEKSVSLGAAFPVVYRNLAMAYARSDQPREKILSMLEKGAQCGGNAMLFTELDRMYEENGIAPDKRLGILEQHQSVIDRDDIIAREAHLKLFAGKADDAIKLLSARFFRSWEGGGRNNGALASEAWANAQLIRGQQQLAARQYKDAIASYEAMLTLPSNLQEALQMPLGQSSPPSARRAEANYWVGVAYDAMGDKTNAQKAWREAAGMSADAASATQPAGRGARGDFAGARGGRGARGARAGGASAPGANVAQSAQFYQAMALQKLGEADRAKAIFQQLIDSGTQAAANATDPSQKSPLADAHFIAGLGYVGLNQKDQARASFAQALIAKPDHLSAKLAASNLAQ